MMRPENSSPVPVQASFFKDLEITDPSARPDDDTPNAVNHLAAAKRLARQMRRLPKPRQTRAGLAICRHLIALLDEVE